MRKHKKQKKLLLFAGLISLVLFFGSTLLLFLLKYDNLWTWYEDVRKYLFAIEDYITGLDKTWEFIGAIMLLYFIKSFFPIYSTSTVCFLTGLVFPIYVAVPVNAVGLFIQFTIKYFWGKKIGAPYAWKLVAKNEQLAALIQSDGKGNPVLLALLRLFPSLPVNTFSAIYGSFDFGYVKFVLISLLGFMPKLIIFYETGKNLFDPLSAGFLVPVMVMTLLTAISCLSVNGVWNLVEKIVSDYDKNKKAKGELKNAQELTDKE